VSTEAHAVVSLDPRLGEARIAKRSFEIGKFVKMKPRSPPSRGFPRLVGHYGLGMSRVSMVNIEAGRQHPPVHVLWDIAQELDVELASLLPSRAEYQQVLQPVRLDEEAVAAIEAAANGDASVREGLMEFIGRARARLGSTGSRQ